MTRKEQINSLLAPALKGFWSPGWPHVLMIAESQYMFHYLWSD